ncbi:MAG: aldo/keto reductase [Bacteroidia bacterium]|nr:aldo/keto reductase [Bacteroidia bacterium]NND25130.1 aldo/keto reductase [Flavobacteriaceae bacterium]RZW41216.1 MAG: aldo/keto reductase [Flavobacteriaceae bacterium]
MNYSKIIAGTMSWGSWGKGFDTNEMTNIIHHCVDNGVTTFDHADIYGDYSTEAQFGSAFLKSGIERDKMQFISKCGIQYVGESRSNSVKHYDYSSKYIIQSLDSTLKNLRTDYLDLFLLHRPSPLMHPHEVLEAVAKLTQEGKLRNFGVSNFTPSQMQLINSEVPIKVNQIEFSLTHFEAMQDGTLDYMLLNNILPMAWSPLGVVFKLEDERTRRIHKQLQQLRNKYNATEDQLLLAWIMKHPSNIHPVIGTTDLQRIENASKAIAFDLELEDWFHILVASQGFKVP